MNIIFTGNKEKKDFYSFLIDLIEYINVYKTHGIYIDNHVYHHNKFQNIKSKSIYNSTVQFDFVISIGGDGALLSAVRRMKDKQLPILGIHIGTLGFLNTATMDNYLKTIDYVLSSKNTKSNYKPLISVKFVNQNKRNIELFALNEIYIHQSYVSRVLSLNVSIDNLELNKYKCDGLIISTPTGSTAYSLSAGGPIVTSDVNGYILTPVSPLSLSSRSIVVNDSSNIKINFESDSNEVVIFADGQESDIVLDGSTICIFKSKISAKIIKTPGDISYFSRLRTQLGWNKWD